VAQDVRGIVESCATPEGGEMLDSTELFESWIEERVIAYVLRPGGPPMSSAPEGESDPLAYPLGVGTDAGILKGFDDRGIVVDSGRRRLSNPPANIEELHFIPWSAILDLKLAR
jgi:hypothetical protein